MPGRGRGKGTVFLRAVGPIVGSEVRQDVLIRFLTAVVGARGQPQRGVHPTRGPRAPHEERRGRPGAVNDGVVAPLGGV